MIDTTIELDHKGLGTKSDMVRIVIWNTLKGDDDRGDYAYIITHQANTAYGKRAAGRAGTPVGVLPTARALISDTAVQEAWAWKRGTITGFRRALGVTHLLGKVLYHARCM